MNIIATYDQFLDLGSGQELVLRGQTFVPPGTGIMNRADHARSLIRQGAAVLPYVEAAQDEPEHDAVGKARARKLAARVRGAIEAVKDGSR